jgi:hypothetical protein
MLSFHRPLLRVLLLPTNAARVTIGRYVQISARSALIYRICLDESIVRNRVGATETIWLPLWHDQDTEGPGAILMLESDWRR